MAERSLWILLGLILARLGEDSSRVEAQTNVYQTIRNNENTTNFANLIDDAGLTTVFEEWNCDVSAQCLTIFAPINTAVSALTQQANWNNLGKAAKAKIIFGHVIRAPKTLSVTELINYGVSLNLMDIGFGQGRRIRFALSSIHYAFQTPARSYSYSETSAYGTRQMSINQESSFYIDTALVVNGNVASTNGMIHVTDQALYNPNGYLPVVDYLLMEPDLKISAEFWLRLATQPSFSWLFGSNEQDMNYLATYFFVTDAGWAQVPEKHMNTLRGNTSLLAEVLSHQFFPNQLVYSQWTATNPQLQLRSGFPSNPGSIDPATLRLSALTRSQTGQVHILSGLASAQVTAPGQKLNRAIVHKVSSALGFFYETREEVIQRLNRNFLPACRADSDCNAKLNSSEKFTFLVPTESVWSRFTSLNKSQQAILLQYMVIPGLIDREKMTPLFGIQIDSLSSAIRFRTDQTALYVESRLPGQGYVSAQLIQANQVAINGIAHAIDEIPGLASQTVQQYLASTPMYSKFSTFAFVQTQSQGGPYIFLAPTNKAIEDMEANIAVGSKLLMDKERRNFVFRRHTFPLTHPFEYLSPAKYLVPTANYAFTDERIQMDIRVPNQNRVMSFTYSGVTTEVQSHTGGYQFTDGIVYQLNRLIYLDADLTRKLCTNPGCP